MNDRVDANLKTTSKIQLPTLRIVLLLLLASLLSAGPLAAQQQNEMQDKTQDTAAHSAGRAAVGADAKTDDENDADQSEQQSEVGTSGEESIKLGELVVTARRREESLLEVPVAMSVMTGEQLEQKGVIDITGLNEFVPNVTFEVSRGTNTTLTPFIRGIGQQDPVAGFEQGVGVYIDDVYLNRPQGAVLDIYNVERIEVLRGPQGTLYGRNTIGGAVKYVTRRIGDEPSIDLKVAGGNFRQIDAIMTFGAPLTDTFKVGGTVGTFQRDGFGDNLNLGIENGSKDIVAGRLSFEWSPREDLFFRLSGDWTDDNSTPRQGARLIPGALSGAPVLKDVFDTRAGLNTPQANVVNRGASLLAEWALDDHFTLKNIVAYRDNKSALPEDFDSLPVDDLDVPVLFNDDQLTEELQLIYEGDKLNGITGFFYMTADAADDFDVILGPTGELLGLPGLNAFTSGRVETDTWSLFGDYTYEFIDHWFVTAGGRWTSDERDAKIFRATFLNGFSPALGGPERNPIAVATDFFGSETFHDFNAHAALSWQPTERHNIYFTFNQGFKGGGFDPRGSAAATPDFDRDGTVEDSEVKEFLQFDPEQVNAYEVGWKASLFNGRLNTALALFWNGYESIQVPGSVGVDTDGDGIEETFVGITSNAGAGRVRGLEFEGQAFLADQLFATGDNLSADWAVGFLDAEFKEFINAFGQDIADVARFQNAPEWTANASLIYDLPLTIFNLPGTLSFVPHASYRGDTNQFEVSSTGLDQKDYILFDFNIIWNSFDGHWSAGIHGRNLTDKEYIVSGFDFVDDATFAPQLGREGTLTAFFGPPLTVTGTITYRY